MGIGPGELLLIIIVALIIFGPARLAEISKTVGKTSRSFRQAASDITAQLNKDILEEEVKSPSLPPTSDDGKAQPVGQPGKEGANDGQQGG